MNFKYANQVKLILLSCVVLLLAFSDAQAQKLPIEYADLDTRVKMSKDKFFDGAFKVEQTIETDQLLNYRVTMPKEWGEKSSDGAVSKLSSSVETVIGSFTGPPNIYARSYAEVKVQYLKREVDLLHWYITYIESKKQSITGIREIVPGQRIEAEVISVGPRGTFVIRSAAILSGSRVILYEYNIPDPFWNAQRDEAVWSVANFAMNYKDDRTIEPHKEYSILDIVKFKYPVSWQISMPKITVVDELRALAVSYNARDELDGRLDAFFLALHVEGTREEHLEKYINLYSETVQFKMGELLETIDNTKFSKAINSGRIDVFRAEAMDGKAITDYEIWVALLETDIYDGYVFMWTTGRNIDFLTWSKNQRSFKIMVESMEFYGHER